MVLRSLVLVPIAAVLFDQAPIAAAYSPTDVHHCVTWVSSDDVTDDMALFDGTAGQPLCRASTNTSATPPVPAQILKSDTLVPVGAALGVGVVVHDGCVLDTAGSDGMAAATPLGLGSYELAVLDESCTVWWRTVTTDVIPPIPELSVQFNGIGGDLWLGLCRAQIGDAMVDPAAASGWTVGLFHMSDFPLFGQCVVQTAGGDVTTLVGGGFDIIQARMGETCEADVGLAATLSTALATRVARYLNPVDRARVEAITGTAFGPMLTAALGLDSCVLKVILSPSRFVPHPLNMVGLHLLRCLLAERMADGRRRALGYHRHGDYTEWMQNGVLFKDFDTLDDNELRTLLRMASGEESTGIPRQFQYTGRNTTHTANDPQYTVHMDTFTTAIKVWVFDENVTLEQGPLHYVKGSQRNTDGKLRWMHNYTTHPATAPEAVIEPSLRLYSPLSPPDLGFAAATPVLSLPGVKRTLVIADTSGLHHRGPAVPGTVRFAMRLKGDNDGGLPRLDPWRLPVEAPALPEVEWEGEIRMSGCNADCGRVEILHHQIWGYVCSDTWTRKEADVACRQLGFSGSFGVMPTFGGGTGKVWLGNVSCAGDEASLLECNTSGWGMHNCGGAQAVGVSCLAENDNTVPLQHETALDAARYASYEPVPLPGHDSLAKSSDESSAAATQSDCVLDSRIPMPFGPDQAAAFVYGDRIQVEMAGMDRLLRSQLCANPGLGDTVVELVEKGLAWGAYGLDFRTLLRPTFTAHGHSTAIGHPLVGGLLDPRIAAVRALYLAPNRHAALHSGFDNLIRYPVRCETEGNEGADRYAHTPAAAAAAANDDASPISQCAVEDVGATIADPAARALFDRLDRDGIALVDDFGLDVAAIKKTADWAVGRRGPGSKGMTSVVSGGSVIAARLAIPEAELLLHNNTVNAALRAYLGGSMVANGYKVVKLQSSLQDGSQYIASEWHHDRVGRRLKLFVFLHDVDCEVGRPTKVANASHDILFYKTEEFPWTRFDDGYVRSRHSVITACGKAGGGFIFDTNSIHKGTPIGTDDRTTIIYEYHPAGKCAFVKHRNMGIPCPSGDQWMVNLAS